LRARGAVYAEKEQYGKAIADFNESIQGNPQFAEAYLDRALAYAAQDDYGRGIADCSRAIELKPDFARAYHGRAWMRRQHLGQTLEAKADADKAALLAPGSAEPMDVRGHVLLALGDAKGALANFNEALRLNPEMISSLWGRGQAYELQGLGSQAIADYRKAIKLKPRGRGVREEQAKALERLAALEAPAAAPSQVQAAAPSVLPARPLAPVGRRAALVIGNGAYKAVSELANPAKDAAAVARQLSRLGFEVTEKHDLGVAAMRKALGEFEDKAAGADWAFVYYAGHGVELNGRNWLIPVDAELARATDTPDEAIPLERVLDRLTVARKLRIVVLDACRNNPFVARMAMGRVTTRAVARGLTAVEPSHGEVVFYAARDGSIALDGSSGNSPFAAALVKHMDEDGVELGRFFRRVTSTVLAATGNQQEPFVYGRIPDEDFYFKPPR
jgi:tetratricopeptide (TPR) repeat protein